MEQIRASLLARDLQNYRTVTRVPRIDSGLYVALAFALAGLIATGISIYFAIPVFDMSQPMP